MYEEDEGDEEQWPAEQLVVPASALEYLQAIYRNPSEPDGRRMRAAMAALPFESPKLAVMATSNLSGEDFASMLERAIQRSREPQRVIEHRPGETKEPVQWSGPIGRRE